MQRFVTLITILCATFLAACGGTTHHKTPTAPKLLHGTQSCNPGPEGSGTMGICQHRVLTRANSKATGSLSGPLVPDVSYFQGNVDWATAKGHISGAIVRVADNFFNDPAFARNWHELRRLKIWHAAYFFLRPGNCAAEAMRGVGLVNAQGGFDSGPLIADAEVPLPYGCVSAFVEQARWSTGLPGIVYTAPGTYPGGPHGNAVLWVATYGSSPGCVWTCSHVAWQYTDGKFGPYPHCIAGIGCDDISTDNGITKLGRTPPVTPADTKVKQAALHHEYELLGLRRAFLAAHNCRSKPLRARPARFAHACRVVKHRGDQGAVIRKRLRKELGIK